jgi:hypothetical protein
MTGCIFFRPENSLGEPKPRVDFAFAKQEYQAERCQEQFSSVMSMCHGWKSRVVYEPETNMFPGQHLPEDLPQDCFQASERSQEVPKEDKGL